MQAPKTLEDWGVYVASVPEGDLVGKARAANGMKFIEMLQRDGMEILDIKKILMMFVRRMRDIEMAPPGGGVYDLRDMLDDPQLDKIKLPEPVEVFDEPPDDVDLFTAEANEP